MWPDKTKNVVAELNTRGIDFSICTLVTNKKQYGELIASFRDGGFQPPRCEFLYIDNTERNAIDAYAGINMFLCAAKGKYIIICHQDVALIDDGIEKLEDKLSELDKFDPQWGLAGNSGGKYLGDLHDLAIRITDPHASNQNKGPFPSRVTAVDENLIIVKAKANLAASGNLTGYHCYGADLALVADILGYHSYAIDFHLKHLSAGTIRARSKLRTGEVHFADAKLALKNKYSSAFSPRWISSPSTELFVFPKMFANIRYNLTTGLVQFARRIREWC